MSMAELETAVRLRLGVTIVVLADDALSQIKAGQERKGYPVTGTTFGSLDYVALAAAFGIEGIIASDRATCRAAFQKPPRDRPVLVAALIDQRGYQL
jgi:acetolactate synthase-1/2/3 large subunit